jgi:o-succinylbenzoate synthase
MPFFFTLHTHVLRFSFEAVTSKSRLREHHSHQLRLQHSDFPDRIGVGEAAPLSHLSPDYSLDRNTWLAELNATIAHANPTADEVDSLLQFVPLHLPAFRFGVETAILSWKRNGSWRLFDNPFTLEQQPLLTNGLIWIGEVDFLRAQIRSKLEAGFSCLKMKIGAHDFATDCQILSEIRQLASADVLTVRLDANGAFSRAEAQSRLDALARFGIHSIEQPLSPTADIEDWAERGKLYANSPIPIALDEELIGNFAHAELFLQEQKPAYIVLKPTLVGGLDITSTWIEHAQNARIGWWITSALESNIGLNAIAQFTAQYNPSLPQGLGTGLLYKNNLPSPLQIDGERLYFRHSE